jgi:hypothetical protein
MILKSHNRILKKRYARPEINMIQLDNSISLVMMSGPIDPPPPPFGSNQKGNSDPFASPFGDKPFN